MRKLTPKQRKFADYYLESGNATKAAIDAGYSSRYAHTNATKLLQNTTIAKYIDERMAEIESAKIAKAAEVLEYLTQVLRGQATETVTVGTGKGAVTIDDSPPSIKDRMAAGRELLKRYPDSDEMLQAQIDKAKADATVAQAKVSKLTAQDGPDKVLFVDSEDAMRQYMREHPDEYEHTSK